MLQHRGGHIHRCHRGGGSKPQPWPRHQRTFCRSRHWHRGRHHRHHRLHSQHRRRRGRHHRGSKHRHQPQPRARPQRTSCRSSSHHRNRGGRHCRLHRLHRLQHRGHHIHRCHRLYLRLQAQRKPQRRERELRRASCCQTVLERLCSSPPGS